MLFFLFPVAFGALSIDPALEEIDSTLKSCHTVEAFLKELPDEFKKNFIFMTKTESIQPAGPDSPRVILQNDTSKTLFAYSTLKDEKGIYRDDSIEMIQFDEKQNRFRFHRIDFENRKGKLSRNDERCLVCHGQNPRPNWDTYDSWANALPFNKDRFYQNSEEERAIHRIFARRKVDPRLNVLQLPKGVEEKEGKIIVTYTDDEVTREIKAPDGVEVKQGGSFFLFPHPKSELPKSEGQGTRLFDGVTGWNVKRVVQEVLNAPTFQKIQYAVLATVLDCKNIQGGFQNYFKPEEIRRREAFFRGTIDTVETDTLTRMNSLLPIKANIQRNNLRRLIQLSQSEQGLTRLPKELEAEITRQLLRRNASVEFFTEDKETGLKQPEQFTLAPMLARLRFILEPDGVNVGKWSLSNSKRSETYTFADRFNFYQVGITNSLRGLIGPLTCEDLAKNSLAF